MEWLRVNDETGEYELVSEEIKLVPEMQALLTLAYNKGKNDHDGRKRYRVKNELKYIYLAYSARSIYKDYSEKERLEEARNDCGYPPTWKPSEELQAVIAIYNKTSPNRIQRLLKTTEAFIDKFEEYLNTIKLSEVKPTEVMATLERLPRLAETLFELERQAKLGVITKVTSKGDHEVGLMALNGKHKRSTRVSSDATTTNGDEGEGEV